jgi:hypothetical protein
VFWQSSVLENFRRMNDVVTVLKIRVASVQRQTQLLTLHLAESLSKNCGMTYLRCMGEKSFMAQLKKVADVRMQRNLAGAGKASSCFSQETRQQRDAASKAVNKKLLDLVQIWGEEFLTMQDRFGLHEYVALYHDLRAKGHPFSLPQLDESRPPIFTPPAVESTAAAASPISKPSKSHGQSPSSQPSVQFPSVRPAGLLEGGAMVLRNQANMVAEMLQTASCASDVKDNDILREMLQELTAAVPRLQSSLEASLDHPELAEELFNLNDDILLSAQLYKHMRKHGPPPVSTGSTAQAPSEHSAVAAAPADEDLLGAFTSNTNTHTESEHAGLSPRKQRNASVSHIRGGALEATGRGTHPADDPFAARGSGADLVGAQRATTSTDLAGGIGPSSQEQRKPVAAFSVSAGLASASAGAAASTPAPSGSIVIGTAGNGKASARRSRVRSGGKGGLRAPPSSLRSRTGSASNTAVDSATGFDDDLLGGFEAPAQAAAPGPAAEVASDPFAAFGTLQEKGQNSDMGLNDLFGGEPAKPGQTFGGQPSGTAPLKRSNNPFDDFF